MENDLLAVTFEINLDDGAELRFGTNEEVIVLKILKFKWCVNWSRDISSDHFAKKRKLLYCPVGGRFKKRNRAMTFFFTFHISHFAFGMTVHCTSRRNYEGKHHFKFPDLILNYLKL